MSAAQPLPTNSSNSAGNMRWDLMMKQKATAGRTVASFRIAVWFRFDSPEGYFRCLLTSLVIANMFTEALPPNTAFRLSSALIIRLFFLSCRPFFLMYAHSFLVTSVRGIGFEPTTSDSTALGCTGFMKAAFGFRLLAAFFAMSSPCEGRPLWTPIARTGCAYYEHFRPYVLLRFQRRVAK